MPYENIADIITQAWLLGFKGYIAFHHMSEAFLDDRIILSAMFAEKYGMRPYAHSNGDRLRKDKSLCKKAAEVFEYIVIGLYDYKTGKEKREEEKFWKERLKGTTVKFSYVGNVYPRAHTRSSERMKKKKVVYPSAICSRPFKRLLVHYDGGVALCCEDMEEDFDLGNAFETPIKDLWFSEKHIQIVKDLNEGFRYKYPLCVTCPIKGNKRLKGICCG
jgi:radical SAM protein with 4Fe4S-binding SPASM domain